MAKQFYRFRPGIGYLAHLWKSATRQDHAHLRRVISQYLPDDGIAIDVGAHGGQFARLLSGIAAHGLVVAVEPSGYARSILRAALWLRGRKNVIVFAAALGFRPGAVLIHTPLKRRGDVGYGLANLVEGGMTSIVEPVAVVTLDSLIEHLALGRVDFVKADIEGYEAELIRGARAVLGKFRPAVFLEMDDRFLRRAGSSLASLWDEMLSLGFAPHEVRGGKVSAISHQSTGGDVLWLPAERHV